MSTPAATLPQGSTFCSVLALTNMSFRKGLHQRPTRRQHTTVTDQPDARVLTNNDLTVCWYYLACAHKSRPSQAAAHSSCVTPSRCPRTLIGRTLTTAQHSLLAVYTTTRYNSAHGASVDSSIFLCRGEQCLSSRACERRPPSTRPNRCQETAEKKGYVESQRFGVPGRIFPRSSTGRRSA